MKRENIIRICLFLVIIAGCLFPVFAMAQGGPGGPLEGADAPIDGGLSVLLAAGVGYGVKKYRDSKKKDKEGEQLDNMK